VHNLASVGTVRGRVTARARKPQSARVDGQAINGSLTRILAMFGSTRSTVTIWWSAAASSNAGPNVRSGSSSTRPAGSAPCWRRWASIWRVRLRMVALSTFSGTAAHIAAHSPSLRRTGLTGQVLSSAVMTASVHTA